MSMRRSGLTLLLVMSSTSCGSGATSTTIRTDYPAPPTQRICGHLVSIEIAIQEVPATTGTVRLHQGQSAVLRYTPACEGVSVTGSLTTVLDVQTDISGQHGLVAQKVSARTPGRATIQVAGVPVAVVVTP